MYDMYFPLFTLFKLVLFIGWLKVAQSIEKPFGEDDADFQMSSLLTRHIRVRQRSPVVKLALIRALNLQPSFRLQVSFSTNSTIFQARSTWSSTLQRRMTKTMTRGNLLLTKKRLSPPKIPWAPANRVPRNSKSEIGAPSGLRTRLWLRTTWTPGGWTLQNWIDFYPTIPWLLRSESDRRDPAPTVSFTAMITAFEKSKRFSKIYVTKSSYIALQLSKYLRKLKQYFWKFQSA